MGQCVGEQGTPWGNRAPHGAACRGTDDFMEQQGAPWGTVGEQTTLWGSRAPRGATDHPVGQQITPWGKRSPHGAVYR